MRQMFILPLLLWTGAATAVVQPECAVENGAEDIFAAPVVVQPIAARPVRVRRGASVAAETVALVTRQFRADRPIRLGGAEPVSYDGDVALSAIRSETGERRCLRDFEGRVQGPQNGRLIACLVDQDADGAYEAAELFPRDDVAHFGRPVRFQRVALVPLETPVRLAQTAPLVAPGHLAATRRILVVALAGGSAELQVEHAMLPPVGAIRQPGGRLESMPRGEPKFEPVAGGRSSVRLADGAVETIGGVRIRIGRSRGRWTMTPLDTRFPQWVAVRCGGSRLDIGRT